MAGGTAAAALRLPRAPGVSGTATSDPPPPSGERKGRGASTGHALRDRGAKGAGDAAAQAPPAPAQPRLPFDLQPAFFANGAWTKRMWIGTRSGARARARGPGPPAPPAPTWHQRRHHGLPLVRWWYRQAAPGFPVLCQRWGLANTVCALAPSWGCSRGPASPGPRGRGLKRAVALRSPARGQASVAHRRPAPRRPRVWDQGGHCGPSPV